MKYLRIKRCKYWIYPFLPICFSLDYWQFACNAKHKFGLLYVVCLMLYILCLCMLHCIFRILEKQSTWWVHWCDYQTQISVSFETSWSVSRVERHAGQWSHGHTPHSHHLTCDFLSSLTSPRVILSRHYQRNAHEMRSRLLLALTDEALSGRCCP